MGIQGLIPFLKKASKQVNIKDYAGCTVAIDAYCWIHKGAFGCAEKLGKGEKTDGYVYYCMKLINSLLSMNINPIMVFDGCNLPAKAGTESQRRQSREKNRKNAKEFLRKGQLKEARECFQRCIDVTSEMALEVIKACHKKGIDCIVAPYEADAQLGYLSRKGIAHIIITEDSDLVLFGCERILFKMDVTGNGLMVEKSQLHLCMGMKADNFTFEKFRYMCIMSGCDYLPSLPGIGLQKSCKFFSRTTNPDLTVVLSKIPFYLNMSNLTVTKEYIEGFIRANNTFLYQLVFDPCERKLSPLSPYPPDVDPTTLEYAGKYLPDHIACQMALGNLNVKTKQIMHNFDPDANAISRKVSSWEKSSNIPCSIWSTHFKPVKFIVERPSKDKCAFVCESRSSTKAKEIVVNTDRLRKRAAERQFSEQLDNVAINEEMNLVDLYCEESPLKRPKSETTDTPQKSLEPVSCHQTFENEKKTPKPLSKSSNPINKFKVTPSTKVTVRSRFFSASEEKTPSKQAPNDTLDWFEQIAMEYEVGSPIPTGRNEKTVDIRGVLNNSAAGGTAAQNLLNLSSKSTSVSSHQSKENKNSSETNLKLETSPVSPIFESITPKPHHPSFAWKKLEKFSFKEDKKASISSPKNHTTFKPVQPTSCSQSSVPTSDDAFGSYDSQDINNGLVSSITSDSFSYKHRSSVITSQSSDGLSSQSSEVVSQEFTNSWKSSQYDDEAELNGSLSPVFNSSSKCSGVESTEYTPKTKDPGTPFTNPRNAVTNSGQKCKTWPRRPCRRTGLSKKTKTKAPKENGFRQLSIGESLQQFQFKKDTFSWTSYCHSRTPLTSVNTDTIVICD